MVAFEAPRPRLRRRRLPEQHDLVMADAARQSRGIEHPEDLLELHDLHDLQIPARAQQRRQELLREPPLLGRHEIERHTDALGRPVRPVLARFVGELEGEILALVEAEQRLRPAGTACNRREQRARRLDHFRRRRHAARLLRARSRSQQRQAGQDDRSTTHIRPLAPGVIGSSGAGRSGSSTHAAPRYFFAVSTTRPRSRPVSTCANPASRSIMTTAAVGSRSLR